MAMALVAPHAVHAQIADSSPAYGRSSCLDTIPASAMTRVPVYAAASPADSTSASARAALPSADVLTQLAAERVRAMLGASEGKLPAGEPAVTWRGLDAELRLTGYRDGRYVWTIGGADTTARGRAGAALLGRALAAVQADGELFAWLDGTPGDSAAFVIALHRPDVDRAGKLTLPKLRLAVPVLSVAAPWDEPAGKIRSNVSPKYPRRPREMNIVGSVILQFVIDTTGRADMSTVRDLWPRDRPRLTGDFGAAYDEFLEAARAALPRYRFTPMRIGGCVVRQRVQLPFEWALAR
jgi:hypothetical protein